MSTDTFGAFGAHTFTTSDVDTDEELLATFRASDAIFARINAVPWPSCSISPLRELGRPSSGGYFFRHSAVRLVTATTPHCMNTSRACAHALGNIDQRAGFR